MSEPVYDAQDMEIHYLAEENHDFRAEIERLKCDLQGIILERDQLLDIQKEREAEIERLRADNAAMFKNLEEQTTRGLQMVGKWQQAEERLAKVVTIVTDHLDAWPSLRIPLLAAIAAVQPEEQ